MAAVLLDTHVWAWILAEQFRISDAASRAVEAAGTVLVSPISFYEIGQKVRIGKWPEMTSSASILPELLAERGGRVADFTAGTAILAASLNWPHRDPFDRMLAATAILHEAVFVSADTAFDGLAAQPDRLGRIW